MSTQCHYMLGSKRMTEEEYRKRTGAKKKKPIVVQKPVKKLSKCWPLKSWSMACHASQVNDLNEHYASHGCPARHTPDGTCIIDNPKVMTQVAELRGILKC